MRAQDPSRFLPADVVAWARSHADELQMIFAEAAQAGEWPSRSALQRRLIQRGDKTELPKLLTEMPSLLWFEDRSPDRITLLLPAQRFCPDADWLLDGFVEILQLAAERYRSDEPRPVIREEDLADRLDLEPRQRQLLGEVLCREAPFFGSGETNDQGWLREVNADIVRYLEVENIDGYLELRASELARHPQLGWESRPPNLDPSSARPTRANGEGPLKVLGGRVPAPVVLFFGALIGCVALLPLFTGVPVLISLGAVTIALAITAASLWLQSGRNRARLVTTALAVLGLLAVGAVAVWPDNLRTETTALNSSERAIVQQVQHELVISDLALKDASDDPLPVRVLPLETQEWARYQHALAAALPGDDWERVALYYDLAATANDNPQSFADGHGHTAIQGLRRQLKPALATLDSHLGDVTGN